VRILIVKLSSLGDVVHALPVVADIHAAHPKATIDWVVEPGFAPLLGRVRGIADVIELPLRRWSKSGWLAAATRGEMLAFARRLRRQRYDAVLDLQGLTKSALVSLFARGPSYGWRIAPTARATSGRRAGWRRMRSGSSRTATPSTARASWWRAPSAPRSAARRRSAWPPPRRRRLTWSASFSFMAPRARTSSGPRRAGSSSAAG
jgi:ADP-heptose:LPS heptosyltransferase